MILGLSLAKIAIEIAMPGIVHVSTDLSNGGQGAIKDQIALRFLMDLEDHEETIKNMMVPGLYSCSHNSISHDYITLRNKYDLKFEFDRINGLVYITEDLDIRGRIWSSPDVEKMQRNLLRNYIEGVLSESERREYFARLGTRARMQKSIFLQNSINLGLNLITAPEVEASGGDAMEVAGDRVVNKTTGKSFATVPLPKARQAIIDAGGLIAYTRKRVMEAAKA